MALFHVVLLLTFYVSSFGDAQECLYESTSQHSISKNQSIINALYFSENAIEIEFDLTVDEHCASTSCNIFYLTNSNQSLSLSINDDAALIVSLVDHQTIAVSESIDAAIAFVDEEVHNIHLLLQLDGSSQSIIMTDNLYWFLPIFPFTSITNTSFTFYASAPSQDPIAGAVAQLCLKSEAGSINTDYVNVSCGDTVSNVMLSDTLSYSYPLILNASYDVTIANCFSTNEIVLNVYDIDSVSLSDSFCDSQHNISIFMDQGIYFMDIMTLNDSDRYTFSVYCTALQEELTEDSALTSALFLLLILGIIMLISCYYCNECVSGVELDKVMVLIIGIGRFDDVQWRLQGVSTAVHDLVHLWQTKYRYDVFICNGDTKRSTQLDVDEFIGENKARLKEGVYQCVIVHIISHGTSDGNGFMTSDGNMIKVEDIRQDLAKAAPEPSELVKIIFNHECREAEFNKVDDKIEDAATYEGFSTVEDSNWATIWATISGHSVTDLVNFTGWISDQFAKNLEQSKKEKKAGFIEIMTEIGINMDHETKGKYSTNMYHALHSQHLILEKCVKEYIQDVKEQEVIEKELEVIACTQLKPKPFVIKISPAHDGVGDS